jgi:glycosyltransferase involved in cell wall biosynthesis
MGGPAHHVGFLSGLLDHERYETLLLHGEIGAGEAQLSTTADRLGVRRETVPGLRPELRPWDDLRALFALIRWVRRYRPDLVHTHTAKAGMLGRLAAMLAGRPRPLIVHTYHGHVLEGYFGPLRNFVYRSLERLLARFSDVLIGVSGATVDDLVRLRIAPRSKFRVIPIGLDLEPFTHPPNGTRAAFRREIGASADDVVLTFVGRLVPIKRVDVALRALSHARASGAAVRLAIVGDGEERPDLERLAAELGVSDVTTFVGYTDDMVEVTAGSDIALLTSANEGTPVSLIEAAAAGRAAVATAVGGVRDVVTSVTGLLTEAGDAEAVGMAIAELGSDPERRTAMGVAAQKHVLERFSVARLLNDIDGLYRELGSHRRS